MSELFIFVFLERVIECITPDPHVHSEAENLGSRGA